MNNPTQNTGILQRILKRIKGWYLVLAVFVTQLVGLLGAIASDFSIRANAEFTEQQLAPLLQFAYISFAITNFLLIIGVAVTYRNVRKALREKLVGRGAEHIDEVYAWKRISSFSWRYSIVLFVASIIFSVIPILVYQVTRLAVTIDQMVYTAIGLVAGILLTTSISFMVLDALIAPARRVLLPQKYEDQLAGDQGINLALKLQSITVGLILTSILLVAPIGYHQMTRALQTGDESVLLTMRIQSIIVSLLVLFFGLVLARLFSQSISNPLDELLGTFADIESGNLRQRATVTSADEVGKLGMNFNRMISQLDELQTSLESQISQRTEQLRATAEVGRAASSILDPDKLIEDVVNLITKRLGYYYAAIFVVSPDGVWAELHSATGEAGAALKARQHRLQVGGQSMVGSAINLRQARIAHDVGLEAVRFNNPLLPDTRSEIALPLMVGGRVLGALDAQSTEENAFDPENTETLLGMANQVAVALENARLYQEAQSALREIRDAQRAQLSSSWSAMADKEEAIEFSIGQEGYQAEDEAATLNIPLSLREQTIGEISIVGDEAWTEDDVSWVTAIARQAAFALENARLLEESQQAALQERIISEITSKIWSSTTIDGILQVAITELGQTLSANEAVIKLDLDEEK